MQLNHQFDLFLIFSGYHVCGHFFSVGVIQAASLYYKTYFDTVVNIFPRYHRELDYLIHDDIWDTKNQKQIKNNIPVFIIKKNTQKMLIIHGIMMTLK